MNRSADASAPSRRGHALAALLLWGWLLLSSGLAHSGTALASSAPDGEGPPGEGCAPTPAYVMLDGQQVVELRAIPGAQDLHQAARRESRELLALARDRSIDVDRITLRESPPFTLIGVRRGEGEFQQVGAVDDRMARCFSTSRTALAGSYRDSIRQAIRRYRQAHSAESWMRGTALAALVLGAYLLWLRGQSAINRRLRVWISRRERFLLQQLGRIGITALVEPDQVRRCLQGLRATLHWSVLLLISYLLIPLLLGFFPPSQGIAQGLRGHIRGVVVGFLSGVVASIPELLSIAMILGITILVIRFSNAIFEALRLGRLRIPGFYREWARPTSRLVAILASVAGVVSAFPYIPGSDSKVFQGAGLFVGVLAALGSSAVATNMISGLMLIYTRAFREGDRVEINGVVGVVQDRTLLVTRIQTPRNELVSIPNATVIGSAVANYSFSRREIRQPVALATTITIGYDVPWRRVHELMLAAARSVPGITDESEPFVLQTSLNDFHISYELNAYVRDAGTYRQTLSDLLAALQDRFAEANVEILSPGYHAIRNGNASTVPPVASDRAAEQGDLAEGT
ncbi:MAG: mechanosensitive ion channel family protein [Synechococcaceae cyanobacterium]|nr:mechanosensitive ion channel family protein [Synechococcaceae cyanobacterium]